MKYNSMFKTLLLILFITAVSQSSLAAGLDDFIIQVQTDLSGPSADTEFLIRTSPSLTYKYNVDCDNDSNFEGLGVTGDFLCIYQGPDEYTIRIEDDMGDGTGFPRVYFNNVGDQKKIVDIVQWGTGKWISMGSAFHGADMMHVSASDVPDLILVTNLGSMFNGASLANPDVSLWNTINITNMSGMFAGATSATPDVSQWNTTNVINMRAMFSLASLANPDVSQWNTGNVMSMVFMFSGALAATPDMSNWNITGLTVPDSMENMLIGITLPTTLYDATLANFDAQTTVSGIVFDGGNSKYCNVAAHDSLINKGWIITDGGLDLSLCPEDVFVNGFEDIIIFKAAQSQFTYDFSEVSITEMDEQPLLIAEGIDANLIPIIRVYLRNDLGQLQIRLDKLIEIDGENNQWNEGQWQSIDNKELTTISW